MDKVYICMHKPRKMEKKNTTLGRKTKESVYLLVNVLNIEDSLIHIQGLAQ